MIYRVTVMGGNARNAITETFRDEPEDRELEALLAKYDATRALVRPVA